MQRTVQRVLAAAGAAAALATGAVLAGPSPAQAATGLLILQTSSGQVVLGNPPAGCRSVFGGFSAVTNRTNVFVVAYTGLNCTGFSLVVDPGSGPVQVGSRQSINVLG